MSDERALPRHIGFIVDGNRRWARQHGIPDYEGHLAGYNTLHDIVQAVFDGGVEYMSMYVFSTENWKRSEDEVSRLMSLIMRVLKSDLPQFQEKNIRVRVLGSREGLSPKVAQAVETAETETAGNTRGTLAICFNYGGQREIVDAVKEIVQAGVPADEITEHTIASHLYAPEVPPLDLLVRTSGEHRISNFMLWRSAYSEMLFLDKLWPDMTKEDVADILETYSKRQRRFGG